MFPPSTIHPAPRTLRSWFLGVLVLASLVLVVSHFGELEHFIEIVRRAEPAWLGLALLLQLGTYVCVSGVWFIALRSAGAEIAMLSLIPLGIAKLFSDQAMPSGGMSGIAFFVAALTRRGIPGQSCMGALLLSLVAYYGACLLAGALTLLLLHLRGAVHLWILLVTLIFSLLAVGIPVAVFGLRRFGNKELPSWMQRVPGLSKLMQSVAEAPQDLLRRPALVASAFLLHAAVFLLDTATLWVMLLVVGAPLTFWEVFPCFVLASMVTTIGPIPMGLGSFEATCVGMLGVMGVPIEAALTATLLLRGFTLWLPMLPGMWLARRALR